MYGQWERTARSVTPAQHARSTNRCCGVECGRSGSKKAPSGAPLFVSFYLKTAICAAVICSWSSLLSTGLRLPRPSCLPTAALQTFHPPQKKPPPKKEEEERGNIRILI